MDTDHAQMGISIELVQGYRTVAEQPLYARARTAPGQFVTRARGGEFNHNYALGADICPCVDGRPTWDAPIEVWVTIGKAIERPGLEWGDHWRTCVDNSARPTAADSETLPHVLRSWRARGSVAPGGQSP